MPLFGNAEDPLTGTLLAWHRDMDFVGGAAPVFSCIAQQVLNNWNH
jgi:hypothetical protein